MLYVQPVYVQSSGDAKYPRLQRVLVSFGDKVSFAPTLEALNQVFGGSSGAAGRFSGSPSARFLWHFGRFDRRFVKLRSL